MTDAQRDALVAAAIAVVAGIVVGALVVHLGRLTQDTPCGCHDEVDEPEAALGQAVDQVFVEAEGEKP